MKNYVWVQIFYWPNRWSVNPDPIERMWIVLLHGDYQRPLISTCSVAYLVEAKYTGHRRLPRRETADVAKSTAEVIELIAALIGFGRSAPSMEAFDLSERDFCSCGCGLDVP